MAEKTYSVEQIAHCLNAQFFGDAGHLIQATASLSAARSNEISFVNQKAYYENLNTTQAGCILLAEDALPFVKGNYILVADPYLAFAKVAQLLDTTPVPNPGVHPSAQVGNRVTLGRDVSVAPGCVIENDCVIGDEVIIGPNTVIGEGTSIGSKTRLFANVSIYHGVTIGDACIIHAGVILGSDGFGFANEKGEWVKIPQTGGLVIGNNVEIGANSCIDRGALENTTISDGVIIDNLCHIAHNVTLGKNVAMAACSGIAGSTNVGEYTTLSGRSSLIGHLDIAPKTHITAGTLVTRSNDKPGVFSSGTVMQENSVWRKNVVRFGKLDDMAKKIKQLEKQLKNMQDKS